MGDPSQEPGPDGEPRNGENPARNGGGNAAGGAGQRQGDAASQGAEDTSTPSPRAPETPQNSADTVAPADGPQTELVLRKLRDLLQQEEINPQLLEEAGMTRSEMEQFVKKFEGAPKAEPGAGREIDAGADPKTPALDPKTFQGPGALRGSSISSRSSRGAGSTPQDDERGLAEGYRSQAPPEIRSRWEAYKTGISRVGASPAPAAPATPPAPGGNR